MLCTTCEIRHVNKIVADPQKQQSQRGLSGHYQANQLEDCLEALEKRHLKFPQSFLKRIGRRTVPEPLRTVSKEIKD